MWYEPEKYKRPITDVNDEFDKLVGELDDGHAKLTLAQFLMRNLGFTVELLTGIKLYPDQIINIKAMLKRNYGMCVWGRGVSKTFTAAVFCLVQCLFNPKSRILVAGPTFRTARFIFNHIENMAGRKEATMLVAALGAKPIKRNDEFKWSINGGSIVAIPLNGEKIRGHRANVLVIDEFLLMSEEIVEKVLSPFLSARQDIEELQAIREEEDRLIALGELDPEDRYEPPKKSKMIALSSASYKCEYLYRKYEQYYKHIYSEELDKDGATYFISQMSWDVIDKDRMDETVIKDAQTNQANTATFRREYCAEFLDDSDGYFSMAKMLECSVPDGEDDTLLLRGRPSKKYILAIDPNAGASLTGDHFAMCVIELDDDPNKMEATIVHNYAAAGKDLKHHIRYFYYLLKNFNIEMIVVDHAGSTFTEAANESELFKKDRIELKSFDFSYEKEGLELAEELKKARREYNKTFNKIVFTQVFTTDFIRKGNEHLQGCINFKKIWFGGVIKGNPSAFNRATSFSFDKKLVGLDAKEDTLAFIDNQEVLIKQVRHQCASIEVKTTAKGAQSFDLPQVLKRDTTINRMRKDSYTSLMLACWAMKAYFDINHVPEEGPATFEPMLI